jgi:hypothetical protein
MKTIIFALALLIMATGAMAQTLTKVEKLTELEILQLKDAREQVLKANNELDRVESEIKVAHKMRDESYMEWSNSVTIDGDYILMRYHNNMDYRALNQILGR